MVGIGKAFRLKRIFRKDGRSLIVAMDHAVFGRVMPGLKEPDETIKKVIRGGADAIMTTFGVIKQCHEILAGNVAVIWTIPTDPRYAETAVKMGVDAVKTTYFGEMQDLDALRKIGVVAEECEKWEMPLLAEIVPGTRTKEGEFKYSREVKDVKTAARCGAEQGADFVKTSYTGSFESFKEVVDSCFVPVLILGGAKIEADEQVLTTVKEAIEAGGVGVAFGRNIWQHKDPTAMTRAIARILHEEASIKEALEELS